MEWIFDNLQLIIVVAGVIAYWFNQRAREKAGQDADYDQDGVPDVRGRPLGGGDGHPAPPLSRQAGDIDQEERARRIREEIMRKIAERRGQAAPPLPEPPRLDPFQPVFREEENPAPVRRVETQPAPPPLPPPLVGDFDQAALERQRRLAEEFERLEEQRAAARRAAQQARHVDPWDQPKLSGAAPAGGANLGGRSIAADLRDPRALRRAFLLREILSPPAALR